MKYIDGRSFDHFWQAYRAQRKNSKKRGIEFLITFDDWKALWLESGKWSQRGRRIGEYVMCRQGDSGAYEVGNVFIGTNAQNSRDAHFGKKMSEDTKNKISNAQKGICRPSRRGIAPYEMTDEIKKKISLAKTGKKIIGRSSDIARSSAMNTPKGLFKSGPEAAAAFGVTTRTAHNRCKSSNFNDWSYA